jgi:hypothetical protein
MQTRAKNMSENNESTNESTSDRIADRLEGAAELADLARSEGGMSKKIGKKTGFWLRLSAAAARMLGKK